MTVLLKAGLEVEDPRLDRVPTGHTRHLDEWPLTLRTMPDRPTAMVMGVNWYSNFDRPVRAKIHGVWRWVIGDGDLGRLRGGHATCLRHWELRDIPGWWAYYDQGQEGRCVEFACLRCQTLHNRIRYDITSRFHYREMQRRDYWPGESPEYEGTSVDAGLQVMRLLGPVPAFYRGAPMSLEEAATLARPDQGISAYRWATSWDMVRTALGVPDWLPGVPMLNSWGRSYPREVILLDAAGERVLAEDGEFGLVTDR